MNTCVNDQVLSVKTRSTGRTVVHDSITPSLTPAEYLARCQNAPVTTASSPGNTRVSMSNASMKPSDYLLSRGLTPRTTEVVRHSPVQCVAVCCNVLQCVAVCELLKLCAKRCCSVLQCVAVCCSVLQCVVVCCSE